MRAKCLIAIAAAFFSWANYAHAGAWTRPKGHGQIIINTWFFRTSNQFDSSGTIQPFQYQGKFQQILFNPYLELGVTHRDTLVVNASSGLLKFSNSFGEINSAGMGDIEIGVLHRLNAVESLWAVSGQVTAVFPAYSANRNPSPGNHQEDVEGRFLVGRSAQWKNRHAYWDVEAAYRYRTGDPSDQFRGDFSAGLDVTPRLLLLAQMYSIKGLGNGIPFSASNPNAQSDFDLYKAQLSGVLTVHRGTRIQVGWNNSFAGRNTGHGNTMLVAIWKTF